MSISDKTMKDRFDNLYHGYILILTDVYNVPIFHGQRVILTQ